MYAYAVLIHISVDKLSLLLPVTFNNLVVLTVICIAVDVTTVL